MLPEVVTKELESLTREQLLTRIQEALEVAAEASVLMAAAEVPKILCGCPYRIVDEYAPDGTYYRQEFRVHTSPYRAYRNHCESLNGEKVGVIQ